MTEVEPVEDLIRKKFFGSMGNSGRSGQPYQESYFGDGRELGFRRGGSRDRLDAIVSSVDVRDKVVLDIGCNIGFFCFGLAAHGARTVGVDYDQDSIDVARASAQAHAVVNASFVRAGFDRTLAEHLAATHGVPDVILLNSVVHWLMYAHDSIREIAHAFEPLLSRDKKQFIVYEPSSTGLAYYPELLTEAGIADFLLSLGVLEYRSIGEFDAENANQKRRYLLGERDVARALRLARSVLRPRAELDGDFRRAFGSTAQVVRKQNKVNVLTDRVIVKTHPDGKTGAASLLRNEADKLERFRSHHAPQLVLSGDVDGGFVMICKRERGVDLHSAWVDAADVPLIQAQLANTLTGLRDAGLAHNDIRPHNLLWHAGTKHLTLLDFEFCSALTESEGDAATGQFRAELLARTTDVAYIDDRLRHLGGKWRSSYGLATLANDRYAAKKVLFALKNRRSYYKRRVLQSVSQLVPAPLRAVLRGLDPRRSGTRK